MGSMPQLETRGWPPAAPRGGRMLTHSCCPHLRVVIKVSLHPLPDSGPQSLPSQATWGLACSPSSVVECPALAAPSAILLLGSWGLEQEQWGQGGRAVYITYRLLQRAWTVPPGVSSFMTDSSARWKLGVLH